MEFPAENSPQPCREGAVCLQQRGHPHAGPVCTCRPQSPTGAAWASRALHPAGPPQHWLSPSRLGWFGRSWRRWVQPTAPHEQPTAPLACPGLQGQAQLSPACGPSSGLGWSCWSGQEASLGARPCLAVSGAALVPVEWGSALGSPSVWLPLKMGWGRGMGRREGVLLPLAILRPESTW